MEFWGTLQKSLGGGAVPADSDAYVNKFFDNTAVEESWAIDEWTAKLKQFVAAQLADGRRVALVTCGSATVPLSGDSVMDAVSFGDRGAASAEHFLRAGYAVIFLHRHGSLAPFSRHFQLYIRDNRFLSMLRVDDTDNSLHVDPPNDDRHAQDLSTILTEAKDTSARLVHVSFTSVQQYLFYLRMAASVIDSAASRGLILLSASVLDYYVPSSIPSIPSNPSIPSTAASSPAPPPPSSNTTKKESSSLTLNLVRIPNLIAKIRRNYAPKACLVTLKSVADKGRLQRAAFRDIERWGVDVVVADSPMLPNELALISPQEEFVASPHLDEDCRHVELEVVCAAMLVEIHRAWSTRRQILKQGKALLLLTAKFSMMKENDTLNEDAMGNKNVPFKRGIRIYTERRHRPPSTSPPLVQTPSELPLPPTSNSTSASSSTTTSSSPMYELDAIFQTKSHCARAHVWKRVADHDDSIKEVMIAFSPAGTPETIRNLWGDLWNGWDEGEIADFKEQIGHVTLSSALYGLAHGVTATVGGMSIVYMYQIYIYIVFKLHFM
ncbi:hypothetical protein DYB35_008334 [Aphanomyces astaci]|uniref:DNA/pantothenate metabolism flavoprotein C-terminal domain-containing protein n=1 Tax=Aphanomyces astaci TaxID=112090 RepID=A0A3R6ZT63_APHAT|nr:hypothetical protein DYB35_008334 [Aphanomyces astaci]